MNCFDILKILSDGKVHSGVEIGRKLGVSRTSVWKSISNECTGSLNIQTVKGLGYQLKGGLDLLDYQIVSNGMGILNNQIQSIELFQEIASTNSYLLAKDTIDLGEKFFVCFAEAQSEGRGRRGRRWVSPYAQNLYLSLKFSLSGGVDKISGLSLVAGVSIAKALQELGVSVGLKWPNDVLFEGKKLAGVLVELSGESESSWDVVVGVGFNVYMDQQHYKSKIDQDWIALSDIGKTQKIKRNDLAILLIKRLICDISSFRKEGFNSFKVFWEKYDTLKGHVVIAQNKKIKGIAQGVDALGALRLETSGGIKTISAGEVERLRHES